MAEHNIQSQILLACGNGNVRLFRNNVGMGWMGGPIERRGGDIILHNPRPLHAGLCKGSADLIGWKTVTITPDMVGQKIAMFVSLEVKDTKGRARPEQQIWYDMVRSMGGIAVIAHSVEEATEKLK